MDSARKASQKRHNPVESICRKIRAIQKREGISNPAQQIIKYHSRSFDTPQTTTKRNAGEVLREMVAAHLPLLNSRSSSSEKAAALISPPTRASPRPPSGSPLSSPENATYSAGLINSENISRLKSQSNQSSASLISQIRRGEFFLSKDLKDCCEDNFSTLTTATLKFESTADQSSKFFISHDSVVRKLSLNEDGWRPEDDDGQEAITYSTNRVWEEELLTSIFNACDTKCRGLVRVGKIIDYLRQTTGQDSEDSGIEEIRNILDPEKRDPQVDLETFCVVVKEWMAHCRNKKDGVKNRLNAIEDYAFEQQGSIKSDKRTTDITDYTTGSFECLGGDMSMGVLEVSDWIIYIADLHFKKQQLEEENSKCKLALETLEEAHSQLAQDCTELRLQIKSAQQAILRTNVLKEELEELKISMIASEEQKTMFVSQNKQLETENRALILKIRALQEENIKNMMDIDILEKKIEELSKTEAEHQKDLRIEELKSTVTEHRSLIENLREDKNKLALELQHLQQELIVNGIRLNVSGEHSGITFEGENSLYYELILAQSTEDNDTEWQCSLTRLSSLHMMMGQEMLLLLREPEPKGVELTAALQKLHEVVSEVGTFIDSTLQWITNPESTVKEKWVKHFTEFKHSMEEKLNLCIVMLNSLGNHKESLVKIFVKLIETLKMFRLAYFCFRKEFLSRLHKDAVTQEVVLRKKLQEASKQLEDAEEQVKGGVWAAPSASEKAESPLCEFEEAVCELRNLQTTNTELSNACQILEQKTRKPRLPREWMATSFSHPTLYMPAFIESLRKQLIEGQLHGLLFQSFVGEFPHYDPLSCSEKIQQPLQEKLKQCCHKPHGGEEARIHQIPLSLKYTCWYTPLLDALNLDSLTAIPRPELTCFSWVTNLTHASCERPKCGAIKDSALDVTKQHKCQGPTGDLVPGSGRSGCTRMNDDLSMDENGVERLCPESPPRSREYLTMPSPTHASSTESTITSSDSGSEILHMASGDLDCKSLCEKEEETRSVSTMIGTSPAHQNIACQDSMQVRSQDKDVLPLEAREEPKTIEEHKKECASGETEVSSLPVTTVKSVNFRQSNNISANEKEVEAEFLRLSLGFKCDWFTLEKRVKLEERSRDLAEENLKEEITNCLKLLESLMPLCEDDNQAQEIIKKLEKSITFISQCTTRVASRAEMLGAINQESRVSKAVEVMIQHVENLKRMYAKEHAELEELKQVLLQNERSFNPLEDEDDCQIQKCSPSLNSKPSSHRRVTIASLPRNLGNAGLVAGMENNRFSRRSSSWRILGSKQSEHRPSLHRFISTYSWPDAENEKCELKTKEDSEPPGEEIVENTRKPSLSEKKNSPSKWDVSSVYDAIASWATHLTISIRKANKALWLSVAVIVLFAALMSFLTGWFFQKSVEAAPTQEGDSWVSLEHILWPFTRLQHNGPPPV